MAKLTVKRIESLKEPGRYQDGQGLMLVVKKSGSRTWSVRVQVLGRRREFGLGPLSRVGLAEARKRASEKRELFRSGVDPWAARTRSATLKTAISTFREAALAAHEVQKAGWKNAKHRAQWLSSLETYAFPMIGNMRVDAIEASDIIDLLLPIWLKKPETARRVRQRVGAVLDWAHGQGLRPSEAPTRSIGKGLPRQPKKDRHFAALPFERVPALMKKLAEDESIGRLALRFLILTAARSGEVRGATWKEIDLEKAIWTVPAERMKAGREHVVPLSPAALAVLETMKKARTGRLAEPVFPGLRGRPLSDMTLTKVLRKAVPVDATVHGLRSSFRDWAAEDMSFPGEVAEAALAHTVPNRVEAAYRRTDFLEKRRSLMRAWAIYLQ